MAASRFARSPLCALLLASLNAVACGASNEGPKTVVDHVARADTPSTTDASGTPVAPTEAPKTETVDVEPVAVPIEGSGLVEAKATVTVHASIETARATVLKFEDYPQFMPEYSDAKHLGSMPSGNAKWYMEITTLGGIAKMFANVEIMPPKTGGPTEVHEGRFVDGNVKQFKAIWTLTKVEDKKLEMTLQVFLQPGIPLPDVLVNKANLDGAKKGVLAMKRRIEAAK